MKRSLAHAFTLIELLVVVAIIVALLAILLPSINKAVELAQRTACASNYHQIHIATLTYTGENFGKFFTCRSKTVQHGFDPVQVNQMQTVGLAVGPKVPVGVGTSQYLPSELWNCPSRNFESQWDPPTQGMYVAAQYFGGIETWRNPLGNFPSRSPITLSASQGNWALVTDSTIKVDRQWGGGRAIFADQPSHKAAGKRSPAGQNQAYVDGSVEWVGVERLIFIHSWNPGGTRNSYFWQQDLGSYTPTPAVMAINDP